MRSYKRIGPGVLLALSLSAPAAWGAESREAKALVASGMQSFKAHDYASASDAFARAYTLDPAPETLLDLAVSELNADKPVEAAAHFRAYLQGGGEPAKAEAVRSKYLPRAEEKLAHVQLVTPAGAEVLVDGKRSLPDPSLGALEVVAGEHDVEVRSAGRSETAHLTAAAGATLMVRAFVDEPPLPPSSTTPPSLPPDSWREPDRGPSAARIGTVVGLGVVALTGVGLGIGFGAAAQSKANAIASGEGCVPTMLTSIPCQHLNYDVSLEHQQEWTSIGGYIGAGVFAAAGVATWLLWPKSSMRVSGSVGPREVGLALQGAVP